jgi:hypothetical protein
MAGSPLGRGISRSIMGVEIINPGWWKSGGELFTDDQRTKFKEQRVLLHLKLDAENGFAMFMKLTSGVSKLRILPAISPSLKVHPNLLQVGHPGSGPQVIAPVPPPHFEPVTDPYGNAWTAQVHRSRSLRRHRSPCSPIRGPARHPETPSLRGER